MVVTFSNRSEFREKLVGLECTKLFGGTVLLALEVWSSDMKKLRGHVNHRARGGWWNEGGLWNKQKHKVSISDQ